jgi:putative endonuclease
MADIKNPDSKKLILGQFGEDVVVKFLELRGVRVLERNWRIKEGEIDIVALYPNGTIAFVEVKTRSSLAFGEPLEAITPAKAARLQRLSLAWRACHARRWGSFQIDCVGVLMQQDGSHIIEYRANVL